MAYDVSPVAMFLDWRAHSGVVPVLTFLTFFQRLLYFKTVLQTFCTKVWWNGLIISLSSVHLMDKLPHHAVMSSEAINHENRTKHLCSAFNCSVSNMTKLKYISICLYLK